MIIIMLGFAIGAVSGVIQFFLLSKFTGAITKGKVGGKTVLFVVTQFLLPFAVLFLCAILLGVEALMMVGIGIAAALIISALIKFFFFSKSAGK